MYTSIRICIAIFDLSAVHNELAAVNDRNAAAVTNRAALNAAVLNHAAVHMKRAAEDGHAAAEIVVSLSSRKRNARIHLARSLFADIQQTGLFAFLRAVYIQNVAISRAKLHLRSFCHLNRAPNCQGMSVAQYGHRASGLNGRAADFHIAGQAYDVFALARAVDRVYRVVKGLFVSRFNHCDRLIFRKRRLWRDAQAQHDQQNPQHHSVSFFHVYLHEL